MHHHHHDCSINDYSAIRSRNRLMTSLLAEFKKTSKGLAVIAGFLVLPSCYYVNQPVLPHQPYQLHSVLSQYHFLSIEKNHERKI